LVFFPAFNSCAGDGKGFKKLESGLQYKIVVDKKQPKGKIGDIIKLNLIYYTPKDSVIFSSYQAGGVPITLLLAFGAWMGIALQRIAARMRSRAWRRRNYPNGYNRDPYWPPTSSEEFKSLRRSRSTAHCDDRGLRRAAASQSKRSPRIRRTLSGRVAFETGLARDGAGVARRNSPQQGC
jgi:hypothetical protein